MVSRNFWLFAGLLAGSNALALAGGLATLAWFDILGIEDKVERATRDLAPVYCGGDETNPCHVRIVREKKQPGPPSSSYYFPQN